MTDLVNGATRPPLSSPDIDTLRRAVKGRVVGPDDPDWNDVRLAWNRRIDQRPLAVVEAVTTEDIVAAVRFARDVEAPVTAQPVGHGATSATSGAILVRTTALTEHHVDVANRTARVSSGTRSRHLNAALQGTGLAALTGSSGDPSVMGMTLGGGLSWFGRAYGVGSNRVRAVDLVTADGELVHVTRDSDPDLFWAIRGSGGEFGIATSMEIDLMPAPQIYGGRILWPIDAAPDLLRAFSRLAETVPDTFTMWVWLLNMPDIDVVPEPVRGRWTVAVDSVFLGPGTQVDYSLDLLRDVAPPMYDGTGDVSIAHVGDIAAEPDDPVPSVGDGFGLTRFDDDAIGQLLDVVRPGDSSLLTVVQVRQLGGAFGRSSPDDGVAGHIDDPFLLMTVGLVPAPEMEHDVASAVGAVRPAMASADSGRVPANFAEGDASLERVYSPATLRRLQELKRERDPQGVIRSNRPLL